MSDKVAEIPQEILGQIAEAERIMFNRKPSIASDYQQGGFFVYYLAQQEIAAKDKEIERLKEELSILDHDETFNTQTQIKSKEEILEDYIGVYSIKFPNSQISLVLQAMEAYAEQQRGCGRWVKIEDSLPDYDILVLWLFEDGLMQVADLDKDGNDWIYEHEVEGFKFARATHWMKINPPNETTS